MTKKQKNALFKGSRKSSRLKFVQIQSLSNILSIKITHYDLWQKTALIKYILILRFLKLVLKHQILRHGDVEAVQPVFLEGAFTL